MKSFDNRPTVNAETLIRCDKDVKAKSERLIGQDRDTKAKPERLKSFDNGPMENAETLIRRGKDTKAKPERLKSFDVRATAFNIHNARLDSGATLRDVADACQISVAAVAKWESGKSMPTIANLVTIASLFGTTIDRIIAVKDAPADGHTAVA